MKVVVLAGGVGGSRFLLGMRARLRETHPDGAGGTTAELTAIVNTGDDIWLAGLRITPDLDTIMYALAGINDTERGWGRGRRDRARLGRARRVGRRDGRGSRSATSTLGASIARTAWLRDGVPLARGRRAAAGALAARRAAAPGDRRRGRDARDGRRSGPAGHAPRPALPGVVDPLPRLAAGARLRAARGRGRRARTRRAGGDRGGRRRRCSPRRTRSSRSARSSAIPGIRDAVRACAGPVVGVSPIIGGAVVRGMADACLTRDRRRDGCRGGRPALRGPRDGWRARRLARRRGRLRRRSRHWPPTASRPGPCRSWMRDEHAERGDRGRGARARRAALARRRLAVARSDRCPTRQRGARRRSEAQSAGRPRAGRRCRRRDEGAADRRDRQLDEPERAVPGRRIRAERGEQGVPERSRDQRGSGALADPRRRRAGARPPVPARRREIRRRQRGQVAEQHGASGPSPASAAAERIAASMPAGVRLEHHLGTWRAEARHRTVTTITRSTRAQATAAAIVSRAIARVSSGPAPRRDLPMAPA